MNRIVRTEPLDLSTDVRKTCRCTIHLGTGVYRCVRPALHAGAHDANVHHDDGFLVRW